ncbi:MAG: hypothetical protein ABMA14_08920 [Hyphomonadaceae bacterium]
MGIGMNRWILALWMLAAPLCACTPASPSTDAASLLCTPVHETSPFTLEPSYFWRTPPTVLGPDESVVLVAHNGSRAIVAREIETEPVGNGEQTRPCTRVYAVVLHNFVVTGVVKGSLKAPAFDVMQASADTIDIDAVMSFPAHGEITFLVVRPANYPHIKSSVPIMVARPLNQDHPCFPTTGIEPAPGC